MSPCTANEQGVAISSPLQGAHLHSADLYFALLPEARLAEATLIDAKPRHASLEELLAGLTLEQQILAMPDAVLRGLSEDYIRSLSPDVQQAIRTRLHRRGEPDKEPARLPPAATRSIRA